MKWANIIPLLEMMCVWIVDSKIDFSIKTLVKYNHILKYSENKLKNRGIFAGRSRQS